MGPFFLDCFVNLPKVFKESQESLKVITNLGRRIKFFRIKSQNPNYLRICVRMKALACEELLVIKGPI